MAQVPRSSRWCTYPVCVHVHTSSFSHTVDGASTRHVYMFTQAQIFNRTRNLETKCSLYSRLTNLNRINQEWTLCGLAPNGGFNWITHSFFGMMQMAQVQIPCAALHCVFVQASIFLSAGFPNASFNIECFALGPKWNHSKRVRKTKPILNQCQQNTESIKNKTED